MKTIFNGYGMTVVETEAGWLRFSGATDVPRDGVETLVEALRKWRSAAPAEAHLARHTNLGNAATKDDGRVFIGGNWPAV
jgi:hypothetical protein